LHGERQRQQDLAITTDSSPVLTKTVATGFEVFNVVPDSSPSIFVSIPRALRKKNKIR
jgi:hypothetical protein